MRIPEAAGRGAPLARMSRARRFAATLRAWAAALVRPPRWSPRDLQARRAARKRLVPWGVFVALAMLASMLWLDVGAIGAARTLPAWLVRFFDEITDFGRSGWFLIPIGLLVVAIAIASCTVDRVSQAVLATLVVRLGYLFLAIGIPGLVVTVVKRWIGRIRPSAEGAFAYAPFSWRPDYASMPSGHATTAFAVLVAIGFIFPRARAVLWIYALLVALSRVVLAAHYPSDVIAGAACGALGAILVREWFAARRLGFFVGSDGKVRGLPGPSPARLKRVARALFAK